VDPAAFDLDGNVFGIKKLCCLLCPEGAPLLTDHGPSNAKDHVLAAHPLAAAELFQPARTTPDAPAGGAAGAGGQQRLSFAPAPRAAAGSNRVVMHYTPEQLRAQFAAWGATSNRAASIRDDEELRVLLAMLSDAGFKPPHVRTSANNEHPTWRVRIPGR
jgi:hypothetical protein